MADSVAATIFELQLDRVRFRAIAARHRRDGDLSGVEKAQTEIVRVEKALADTRAQPGGQARDRRIAELLHLSEHEFDARTPEALVLGTGRARGDRHDVASGRREIDEEHGAHGGGLDGGRFEPA